MTEYTFSQLVDIAQVRQLLESHHRLSRMAYGILDPDENILVAVGWQDVCSRFHRSNPISNARCLESNTYIHDHLLECEGEYLESQCKNGLIDVALPIVISGKHVATFYAGQFFYDDRPDTTFFRNQASELGFDVDDYLASLELVPVFSRDYVRDNMLFLRNMVNVLAETGLNNFRHASEKEERKLTEQRLELLGFALDNVHEAAFLMDLSGRFHYVNQNACRSLDYTRDELLGMAIPDIDPDYQEESLPHVFDRLLEQGTHTFETRHQAKDGRIFPVEITSTVLEHNGARYNLALVRDITERKAAQAMLEDERLLLKTLIQTLPDPVWLKDVNGVYIACNAAFGRLYDDTPSGIAGRTDNDYVDDELAAFFQQKDREAIAAGQPRTNEEWVTYAADGRRALWETTKTPVCDAQGRVVGALGVARDITERKRMEDALRKNERKYRTLAESLPDNIIRYDRECRATYYNSMLAESVAIEEERFLGKTPVEAHPETEEMAGLYESKIRQVLAGGAPGELEIVVPHPDGGLRTHLIRIVAEHDAEGAITGALAIGRDITDRKQTERQLQDARSRLFAVFTAIPDMVWLKNAAGVYLACNPAFEKFFGALEAEIIGKTDHDFVPTELADFFIQKDREAMSAGSVCINEEEIVYADDGRRGILETRKVPVYDVDGIISGVLGVARDITERKQTEERLRASEQRFREIFDNSLDCLYLLEVTAEGRFRNLEINPAFERSTGMTRAELIGKYVDETVSEEIGATVVAKYRRCVAAGIAIDEEVELNLPGGRRFYHSTLIPVRDESGRIHRIVGITRDITERKRHEILDESRLRLFERLAHGAPLPELLDHVVTYAETSCPDFIASIMLVSSDGKHLFSASAPHLPADYTAAIDGIEIGEGVGSCGTAVWRGEPVIAEDVRTHPYWAPYKELALRAGLLSCWSEPIFDSASKVLGTFGIYQRKPGGPSAYDQEVIRQSAHLAAIVFEHKRMEELLRKREHEFRTLAENLPDNILRYDRQGRMIYGNSRMLKLLGIESHQLSDKTIEELHAENKQNKGDYYAKLRRVLASGEPDEIEFPVSPPNGTVQTHNVRFSAERDEEGKIVGVLAIGRDITARKRTEAALRESEEKFRSIFEAAAAGMVLIAPDGHFLQSNRAISTFLGYTEEEMRQRTVEDVTHPEDRERTRSIHKRLAAGEEYIHYEKRYLRKDGETVWGYVSIAVVHDPESRPLYSVGMVQDLTGYKQFEAELLARERQYRDLSEEFQTLLNGIPDLILHLSPQLSVVWANQAATEYVGHDPKGLPCYTLFHDRATPCERCPIIRAFASGENEEELMIDKGGRHWGVKAFPLKDQQGRVVSVIDYATDITEKMHLRDAAAQAKHLAALGELSAGVAHEINNPNGVILLNSAFLKRVFNEVTPLLAASTRRRHPLLIAGMEIDEVLREMPLLLSEVHDGARRIQRIVDGLKEFVRTPVADPEPVDLNSVVAAAIRVTAVQIEAATAHFTITYGAGVETVQGCRQAIEQVVINLLTNACQALPDQERGIWITTRFLAESGKAMIEVRDAGSGILPENLPHITDPFFTTKRQSGGTGLGLSISNSLIKECGGTLQFFSSPGAGTTVTVTLPLWKAKDKR